MPNFKHDQPHYSQCFNLRWWPMFWMDRCINIGCLSLPLPPSPPVPLPSRIFQTTTGITLPSRRLAQGSFGLTLRPPSATCRTNRSASVRLSYLAHAPRSSMLMSNNETRMQRQLEMTKLKSGKMSGVVQWPARVDEADTGFVTGVLY